MLICIKKLCINQAGIDINHILCFSFGYLYYCIIPFMCFEWEIEFPSVPYNNILNIYKTIPSSRIYYYIISMIIIYLCFIIGSAYAKVKYRFFDIETRIFHTKDANFNYSQKLAYPLMILLGLVLLYFNKSSLFRGYVYFVTAARDSYDSTRVLLSVFEFIIVICTLYYLHSNPQFTMFRKMLNKWTVSLIIYSLILLTTGGRLYVVTALLSVVIFFSFSKSINFRVRVLLLFGILSAFMMGLIGASRLGFAGFNFNSAFFNILEEPLYTNYSNITYLNKYSPFNIVCVPVTLFSAFTNLLPTKLFPWKLDVIKQINAIYPEIEQPLGAMHFYPSYNAGLGLLLSMFLFYLMGKWMSSLRKSYEDASVTKRMIYCLVCSNMAFTLFRDAISISLIKNILEFSVVAPWIISALNDCFYKAQKR